MSRAGVGVAAGGRVAALAVVVFTLGAVQNLVVHGTQLTLVRAAYDILAAAVMAVFLAWLVPRIRLNLTSLTMLLWLEIFSIEFMINYVEGAFFTTTFASSFQSVGLSVSFAVVVSGVEATSAAFLLGERGVIPGVKDLLRQYLSTRTRGSWTRRIVVASVVYFPIYLFFGLLVTPFVLPYYTNPSSGVVIPSFFVMVPLELFRGLLFVLVLLPLMAALVGGRNTRAAALAAVLYIPGGFVALVGSSGLPPEIVPFHAIEILADSIVYGFALSRILQTKVGQP